MPFDADGAIASAGGIVGRGRRSALCSPIRTSSAPGPKSLDRNEFTLDPRRRGLSNSPTARVRSAAVSAAAILKSAEGQPDVPKLWIVCGGGRKNPHILADLREGAASRGAAVILAEDAGFDGDAMEAEAWAYLAVRSLKGLPLTFPTTTGCRTPVSGGVLVRPAATLK